MKKLFILLMVGLLVIAGVSGVAVLNASAEEDVCPPGVRAAGWIYFDFPAGTCHHKIIPYTNADPVDLEIGTQDCCILDDIVGIYVDGCLIGEHRSKDGIKYDYHTVSLAPGNHTIDLHISESGSVGASGWYYQLTEKPFTGTGWPCAGTLEVEIDIKPLSDPNSINLKSRGVIPVAILTTPAFDATTVNPGSVVFADAGMDHYLLACLTGETYGGFPIGGCDSVRTVPPQ